MSSLKGKTQQQKWVSSDSEEMCNWLLSYSQNLKLQDLGQEERIKYMQLTLWSDVNVKKHRVPSYVGKSQKKVTVKIALPPGHFYSTLGAVFLNKKAYERIIEPSVTMMQEEYFEAYNQGRTKMATWIKVRFFFEFLMILGLNLPVVKQLLDITQKLAK